MPADEHEHAFQANRPATERAGGPSLRPQVPPGT
jgi:hypothetical protein